MTQKQEQITGLDSMWEECLSLSNHVTLNGEVPISQDVEPRSESSEETLPSNRDPKTDKT